MKIQEFDWDERNIAHIARHQVSPGEVEEVAFDDEPHIRKYKDLHYLYGQSLSGKYLFTAYFLRGPGIVWVVASREMDNTERKLYRGWKG